LWDWRKLVVVEEVERDQDKWKKRRGSRFKGFELAQVFIY
jgi:hypothetical protein